MYNSTLGDDDGLGSVLQVWLTCDHSIDRHQISLSVHRYPVRRVWQGLNQSGGKGCIYSGVTMSMTACMATMLTNPSCRAVSGLRLLKLPVSDWAIPLKMLSYIPDCWEVMPSCVDHIQCIRHNRGWAVGCLRHKIYIVRAMVDIFLWEPHELICRTSPTIWVRSFSYVEKTL